MTHTVPITRAGDTQPVRPDGVVIIDRDTGLPVPTLAQGLTRVQLDAAPVRTADTVLDSASPHCKLIAQRMVEQIRAAYSIDDEMYFARIGVGAATGMYQPSSDELQAMTVFGEFVESVRQWGRQQRAELGL